MPEEIRGFAEKPPFSDPAAALFQKQNPQVPNLMGPKQPASGGLALTGRFHSR